MYSDDEQKIGDMVSKPGFRAIKCYCYTPKAEFSTNLAISEFLPESAWVVANEKKLPIVLHLMRPSGLSDEENFSYIMEKTKQYSDAKLVLAHCARGFVSWTVVDQIRKLVDRDNIWFDMAAICEVGPMMAAYMHSAGKRIVWGTDWPICLYRGRAISMGISQQWLTNDDPTVGYGLLAAESLMAFHQTASLLNLDQTQVDDIFYHNAVNLFGVQ
jgi:glutamate-1-semialdehyde 2,1-aminomutase